MVAAAVGIQEGRVNGHQVWLLELFGSLEGLVEDRAREQIAHLDAHQRLAAARRGPRHFHVETMIRRAFVFEIHLALDLQRFNQRGHRPVL